MNIIAVDDEKNALEGLISCIEKVKPNAKINGFSNEKDAIKYVKDNSCEIAFLDIEIRNASGIDLAKQIKSINPKANIIFTTGYSEYMDDAFNIHASGYILKPVTIEKVKKELSDLRYNNFKVSKKKIYVQTFGNFEIFVDNSPLKFKYTKTKELLAYLVDRHGSLCTNKELMSILWEDRVRESYFKKLRVDLIETLSALDCDDIIVRQWGKMGISINKIECDYYNWIDGKLNSINLYQGEYMSQYSWAEKTLGNLATKI